MNIGEQPDAKGPQFKYIYIKEPKIPPQVPVEPEIKTKTPSNLSINMCKNFKEILSGEIASFVKLPTFRSYYREKNCPFKRNVVGPPKALPESSILKKEGK